MASLRRLAADHATLHKSELPPYYLFPSNVTAADDLSQLTVLLAGPPGTPYADGLWKLSLRIPHDYPASPPKAFFKTKIWHPNVEESNGSVCLDTLKRDWQPRLTLRDILITISCLLINPNPDSALNSTAGKLLQEDWDDYASHARLMTSIHARVPRHHEEAVAAARRRGEEHNEMHMPVFSPDDNISDDEEQENDSKENDAAPWAAAESRLVVGLRRPTVLGKRPLAELPIPAELDEEEQPSSARNIAANTPHLSSHLASISFKASRSTRQAPAGGATAARPQPSPLEPGRAAAGHCAQDGLGDDVWGQAGAARPGERACKRVRASADVARDGFLLHAEHNTVRIFVEQPTAPDPAMSLRSDPGPAMGLGLRFPDASGAATPTPRKLGAIAAGAGSRSKPRVGLRRL